MLKFIKYILLSVVFAVVFTGCTRDAKEDLTEHQKSITSAEVSWNIDGREYSANVVLDKAGTSPEGGFVPATVTVTAPESIEGTVLSYSGETATASVGTVSFALAENMGMEVYRIVKSLCPDKAERKGAGTGDGTSVVYECELYGGVTSFDITYGDDKYPKSAHITWDDGEMSVNYGSIAATN